MTLFGITEMMDYFKEWYGVTYAPNSRETVRRFTVHQFVMLGLINRNPDNPQRPTNSPDNRYQIEPTAFDLLRTYQKPGWPGRLATYLKSAEALRALRARERNMSIIHITTIDAQSIVLSAGGQNVLMKAILEQFCSRFTQDGRVVYVGDAGAKLRPGELNYLQSLGVKLDEHGQFPDVIIHCVKRNWLVLIEAVTSHGPINQKRMNELKALFGSSTAGLVFVTCFPTRRIMNRYLSEIAWESDVWLAEDPDHLIHFNGDKFLGPY